MEYIIARINALQPLSEETINALKESVTKCHFPKKYQLIREGIYCKSAYFIEKGLTRSFWLVDGQEITTSFAGEGCIVFSMDELYYDQISEEYVETIEEVDAYRISIERLRELFQTNIEMANWGRIIHQNEYRRLHRTYKDRLTLPAKERYESFKQMFPDIYSRAPLKHIASYLGLTLPTLSRIRSRR